MGLLRAHNGGEGGGARVGLLEIAVAGGTVGLGIVVQVCTRDEIGSKQQLHHQKGIGK